VPGADGSLRFYLGEPIRLKWEAPHTHSRRDWVGIYRVRGASSLSIFSSSLPQVGANKSNLVTRTSSMGMWAPVHDEEWDGDVPSGQSRPSVSAHTDSETGVITFKGNTLPWIAGHYEVLSVPQ
jgi:phosphatidylethanolamine N-methyltransferase